MINERPQAIGEYVMVGTDPLDVDLARISLRYGLTIAAIATAASRDPYWQSQGQSPSSNQVVDRVAQGNAVLVPIPAAEERMVWGLYTNATGREVTLADAAAEINARPTTAPQPRVTPALLWSYVSSAPLRALVIQNRSDAQIRHFDDDTSSVPVPAGAAVRFPMVEPDRTRPVCVAAGCSVALAPLPAWLPSFDHHVLEIERTAARLRFVLELLERVHREGAAQVASVDFALELTARARRASQVETGYGDRLATEAEHSISDLKARMVEYMVTRIGELRPEWRDELQRLARLLVSLLNDPRFLEQWHLLLTEEPYFAHQSDERRGHVFSQLAQAIYALGMSDAPAAWACFADSLSAVDAHRAESSPPDNIVSFTVNRWSNLWTVANAGGGASGAYSLASTIVNMQILYTIRAPGLVQSPTLAARLTFWRDLIATPLTAEVKDTLARALAQGGHLERPGVAFAIYGRALGSAAGAFSLTFALIGLATTYADGQSHTQVWDEIAHGLSITSAVGSGGNASVQTAQAIRAMFVDASGGVPWGQGVAEFAGGAAGVLAFVQGLYQLGTYTYFAVTDPSRARGTNLLLGAVTMASAILTVAAVSSTVPGLQLAAVLLAIGAIVIAAWPDNSPNARNFVKQLIHSIAADAIAAPSDQPNYDDSFLRGGLGWQSLFTMITRGSTGHPLAAAQSLAVSKVEAWPGHVLQNNPSTTRFLSSRGFTQAQIALLVASTPEPPDPMQTSHAHGQSNSREVIFE